MRTKQGVITSATMKDTVTVTVHRSVVHPLYQKRYRMSKKFLADTNGKQVGVGDLVEITECRPLSKRKHFRVTNILTTGPRVSELAEEASLGDVMHRKESPDSAKASPGKKETSSVSSRT